MGVWESYVYYLEGANLIHVNTCDWSNHKITDVWFGLDFELVPETMEDHYAFESVVVQLD